MTEAVVVIPGIMGSVLEDDAGVVWPGSLKDILLGYKAFERLTKVDLKATDVIRSVSFVDQYDDLIQALKNCGFKEKPAPGDHATLAVVPYDWRKDNALACEELATRLDQMAADLGNDCTINLIAHSMGGLICRAYLESGKYNQRNGYSRVARLITLGTPHRGAPLALTAALGQEKRVFLSAAQVKEIANNKAFPSLYQLLPPQGEPFVWDRADQHRYEPVDVFEPKVAAKLKLVQENLDSAAKFHQMLDLTKRPKHVRYFFFAGTQHDTPCSIQLTVTQNAAEALKVVRKAGDGTVPIWSGSLSGVQMEPTGGEHGDIYKNKGLKSILGNLLGKAGLMLAAGPTPELSVLPKVALSKQSVQLVIELPKDTNVIDGELILKRQTDAKGAKIPAAKPFRTDQVRYNGLPIDHLALLIEAPEYAGVYSLEFVDKKLGAAVTELIVQEPEA